MKKRGKCWCGCGEDAPIAKRDNVEIGNIKGQPTRYLLGHTIPKRQQQIQKEIKALYLEEKPQEVDYGKCWCGCGEDTPVVKYTNFKKKLVRGDPKRYLPQHAESHQLRKELEIRYLKEKPEGIDYGKCWCGCGKDTPLAKQSDIRKGDIRGGPKRRLKGHASMVTIQKLQKEFDSAYLKAKPEGVDYGKCWCGCGEDASTAQQSHIKSRNVKGRPKRYVTGHSSRIKARLLGRELEARYHKEKPEEVEYGKCWCGCGKDTLLATRNKTSNGDIQGKPKKYLAGHPLDTKKVKRPPKNQQLRRELSAIYLKDKPQGVDYGKCWCGCGEQAPIAAQSHVGDGNIKGQPKKYLPYHAAMAKTHQVRKEFESKYLKEKPEGIGHGKCWCGCGEKAPIAKYNSTKSGDVKGQPKRYLPKHQSRVRGQKGLKKFKTAYLSEKPEGVDYGKCWCGCGRETLICGYNAFNQGKGKGVPHRYIAAHQNFDSKGWETAYDEVAADYVTPCWIWNRCLDDNGYGFGIIWIDGVRYYRAHRAAWVKANGPLPPGETVDHMCVNPACIRVDHLMACSQRDNNRLQKLRLEIKKLERERDRLKALVEQQ